MINLIYFVIGTKMKLLKYYFNFVNIFKKLREIGKNAVVLLIRWFGRFHRSFGRTVSAVFDRSFGRSFGFGRTLKVTQKAIYLKKMDGPEMDFTPLDQEE